MLIQANGKPYRHIAPSRNERVHDRYELFCSFENRKHWHEALNHNTREQRNP